MPEVDAPLAMLDEAAIALAELRHDPYDFAFVEHALAPDLKDQVLADAPGIPDRGSYAPARPQLRTRIRRRRAGPAHASASATWWSASSTWT